MARTRPPLKSAPTPSFWTMLFCMGHTDALTKHPPSLSLRRCRHSGDVWASAIIWAIFSPLSLSCRPMFGVRPIYTRHSVSKKQMCLSWRGTGCLHAMCMLGMEAAPCWERCEGHEEHLTRRGPSETASVAADVIIRVFSTSARCISASMAISLIDCISLTATSYRPTGCRRLPALLPYNQHHWTLTVEDGYITSGVGMDLPAGVVAMDANAPARPPMAMTCQSFRSLPGPPNALPAMQETSSEDERVVSVFRHDYTPPAGLCGRQAGSAFARCVCVRNHASLGHRDKGASRINPPLKTFSR